MIRATHSITILAVAVSTFSMTLAACDGGQGTADLASESQACVETETALGIDEMSALGITATEILALVEGDHASVLTYDEGGSADLQITVIGNGDSAVYVDSEQAPDDTGIQNAMDIEALCLDRIEIPASISFTTSDGAFEESWSLDLVAEEDAAQAGTTDGTTSFSQEVSPDGISGTYVFDPTSLDPSAEYDDSGVDFYGTFSEAGTWGTISGWATGSDDAEDGDVGTAWITNIDIATWDIDEFTW